MKRGTFRLREWVCLLIWFSLSGCTTFKMVTAGSPEIEVGDHVRIEKVDGSVVEFEIESVSSERITGDGLSVLYAEIETVQIRKPAPLKTAGAATATLLVIAAAASIYLLVDTLESIAD
ncbi:MAG: hypothetical protein AAFX56_02580 [Pseudomonadota bacterium]